MLGFLAGHPFRRSTVDGRSPEERNKAVVLHYMQEVMTERKLDVLDEPMAEDRIAHNPTEPNRPETEIGPR